MKHYKVTKEFGDIIGLSQIDISYNQDAITKRFIDFSILHKLITKEDDKYYRINKHAKLFKLLKVELVNPEMLLKTLAGCGVLKEVQ